MIDFIFIMIFIAVAFFIGLFGFSQIILTLFFALPRAIQLRRENKLAIPIPKHTFILPPIIWIIILLALSFIIYRFFFRFQIPYLIGSIVALLVTIILVLKKSLDMEHDWQTTWGKYMKTEIETPLLTALVRIMPDGSYTANINPANANLDCIILMTMCYLVKIRWLLNTVEQDADKSLDTPSGIINDFLKVLKAGIDMIPTDPATKYNIVDRVFIPKYKMLEKLPKAYVEGESFLIRLFKKPGNIFTIDNTLPQPGLAINIWRNWFVLLETTISRIGDAKSLQQFKYTLQEIASICESDKANETSIESLLQLIVHANIAIQQVKNKSQ